MQKLYVDYALLGLFGTLITFWNAGCSNHGGFLKVNSTGTNPTQTAAVAGTNPISGSWLCIDENCPEDTVKTISQNLNQVVTDSTERSATSDPQSICRIRETEILTLTSSSNGKLSHLPLSLVESAENTHDCDAIVAKLNEIAPQEIGVSLTRNAEKPEELIINGVRYRKLSDSELKQINSRHTMLDPRFPTVAGQWQCIDDSCQKTKTQLEISGDLKTLRIDSIMKFPTENQICHLTQSSKLDIFPDNTNPQLIYATRTRGPLSLAQSAENTDKCGDLIGVINDAMTLGGSTDQISIQRDGNQELVLVEKDGEKDGVKKRYIRSISP